MYAFFRTLNLVRQRLILTWVKGSGRGKREPVTATARRGGKGMGRMERSTTTVRIHIAGTSAILVAFTAAWISCLAALPRPPQQAAGVFVLAVALVAAIQVEKTLDVKEARRCARESELEEVMSAEPRSSHVDRRPLLQFPG